MGKEAGKVKDLKEITKKMYLSKILKVKNELGIDWIQTYKSETGKDVDLSNTDIESKMELLEFIYDNDERRKLFNEDLNKLELNKTNKTKKESSKIEIIKKNVIDEIDSFVSVMTKEEIEESINLMTAKKKELEEKEEKETYVKRFATLPIEEMKRLLDK